MPHWRSMHDSEYIYAHDLQGKDVTLVIDRITGGELTGQGGKKARKPLCYFRGTNSGKPLALNKTNCKIVAKLYGDDTDNWVGKRITLYATETQFGGETMPCIRIRPKIPAGKQVDEPEREPGAEG